MPLPTPRAREGRVLKFLCLFDGNVRLRRDMGRYSDGRPTGKRQAIIRMLSKTIEIGGMPVGIFSLAEPPTEAWEKDDFDHTHLISKGKWDVASDEWLKHREGFLAIREMEIEAAHEEAKRRAGGELADRLVSLAATQPSPKQSAAMPARSK